MAAITAFMIVRNEEVLLPRCLTSLAGVVDELVVLDTGSTDGTTRLLDRTAASGRFARVRWEPHGFTDFGTARQAALDRVTTPWALWLDADEEISPMLRARLLDLRQSGHLADHDGWRIRRANRVLGRVMKARKLAADYGLRLFRTEAGRLSEALVHEGIVMAPGTSTGRIDEPIYHDTLTAIRPYLRKVDRYTNLDVAQPGDKRFDLLHLCVTGPLTFFREYLGRGCARDGWPGFVWSAIAAWTAVQRDWKRLRRDWQTSGRNG